MTHELPGHTPKAEILLRDPRAVIEAVSERGQQVNSLWTEIVPLKEDPNLQGNLSLTFSIRDDQFRIEITEDFLAISRDAGENVAAPCLVVRQKEGLVTVGQGTIKNGSLRENEAPLQTTALKEGDLRLLRETLQTLNSSRDHLQEELVTAKVQSAVISDLGEKISSNQPTPFDKLQSGRALAETIVSENTPLTLEERTSLLGKLKEATENCKDIENSIYEVLISSGISITLMASIIHANFYQETGNITGNIIGNLGLGTAAGVLFYFISSTLYSSINKDNRRVIRDNLRAIHATIEDAVRRTSVIYPPSS